MNKYQTNLTKAKERWEEVFEEDMSDDEFTMFQWGYIYGVNDMLKLLKKKEQEGGEDK